MIRLFAVQESRSRKRGNMKRILLGLLFLSVASIAYSGSRDLLKYVPRNSFFVVGADFQKLRGNDIFTTMEQKGQVWSAKENFETAAYFKTVGIDPKKDVRTFVYSRYLNPYGNQGDLRLFELMKELLGKLPEKDSTKYLGFLLCRLDPAEDSYAVSLDQTTIAFGALNEVKIAVDLARGKIAGIRENGELNSLLGNIPSDSPVWGVARPFARREAAALKAQQSTSPVLEAFEYYFFYGKPTKTTASAHFYARAAGDSEATFAQTFMIGILTFSKFKVEDNVAEMLDQVNIERDGRDIHVSGVVTQEMVDAYFKGDLGVK